MLIICIIATAVISVLITSLVFYFAIYRKFSRYINEKARKRGIELEYAKMEIETSKKVGDGHVKE